MFIYSILIILLISLVVRTQRLPNDPILSRSRPGSEELMKSHELRKEIRDLQIQQDNLMKEGKREEAEQLSYTISKKHEEIRNTYTEDGVYRGRQVHKGEADILARSQRHRDPIKSRHEMERDKEQKFHDMIRGRIDNMISQIDSSSMSSEEATALKKEIEEYYQLELKLIESRTSISKDFEKARTIKDADERRAYLEDARVKREQRRIEDEKIRDVVLHKRDYLRDLVLEKTGAKPDL